ncbi:MAG: HzsA-related protein, partial [Planctomycetota bacterium]
ALVAMPGRPAAVAAEPVEVVVDLDGELKTQFDDLVGQLKQRSWFKKIANQTYDYQSLILETDRDPVDIVLRRTEALLDDLKGKIDRSEHERLGKELAELRRQVEKPREESDGPKTGSIPLMKGWKVMRSADGGGVADKFVRPDFDDSSWDDHEVVSGKTPFGERHIFYRKWVDVPASWRGKNVGLDFGAVDDDAVVYVNGKKVGEHRGWDEEFGFTVTKRIKPGSRNLIAVNCANGAGSGGIHKPVALSLGSAGGRYEIYAEICRLRRRIALANPLLDFDKVIFMTGHYTTNHCCDQYFGKNARPGGGVYVLSDPFGESPKLTDVLGESVVERGRLKGQKLNTGSFRSLSLDYDASRVFFAYTQCGKGAAWSPEKSWHVFKARSDGAGLEQLTDGSWNEFAPCVLPNGRIVFISERRGGFGRCHPRPVPTYTLHSMRDDGSDIVALSYHETNEWHPSVTNDGMIVYTRWDYVDRGDCIAHHPWITYPDGRDARAIHGNFPTNRNHRPDMELHCRAIPGSHRFVATAAGHHRQAYGSLVMFDPRVEDDGAMAPVKRLTPEIPFPETERGSHVYGTAWPLSEHYYLAVYAPGGRGTLGVYVVDVFGNKELLYRNPSINCIHPIPFRPYRKPPVIPHATAIGKPNGNGHKGPVPTTGTVMCMNVFNGLKPWPEGTKLKKLRVIQLYPKATIKIDDPRISMVQESLARGVLGTVPIEDDGSVHFTLPAGKPVYFQVLDEQGLAIQSMMSETYVHPGERLSCQGCHEPRLGAPSAPRVVEAMKRGPSKLEPDVEGSYPLSFPRLVQPVLDRKCSPCHQKNKNKKAPNLSGTEKVRHSWSKAYDTLHRYGSGGSGKPPNRQPVRTVPGKFGAYASKLLQVLARHKKEKGKDFDLSAEEMHRITLWLDCNCNFFGAYLEVDKQMRGELVMPSIE